MLFLLNFVWNIEKYRSCQPERLHLVVNATQMACQLHDKPKYVLFKGFCVTHSLEIFFCSWRVCRAMSFSDNTCPGNKLGISRASLHFTFLLLSPSMKTTVLVVLLFSSCFASSLYQEWSAKANSKRADQATITCQTVNNQCVNRT